MINEILTSNQNGIADSDLEHSDWIEIANSGWSDIDLAGFILTDDPYDSTRWTFPSVEIPAGGYLLVWASGKDRNDPSELHTDFKISAGGEFVGLYGSDGNVIDSVSFGSQTTDVSLGRIPDRTGVFVSCSIPTPGVSNQVSATLEFSHAEGVYPGPISLEIRTNQAGARIIATMDCRLPDSGGPEVIGSIPISKNTVVRAAVFMGDSAITDVITRTYIVGENPTLPTAFLVTEPENLYDRDTGLFTHVYETGDAWERPVWLSLVEDNQNCFSVSAGIRIHGATARNFPKHNLRLYFRSEYGLSELVYPLFPQKPVDHFKRLLLYAPGGDHPAGHDFYTHIQDAFNHVLLSEIGGNTSAFKPVVLYLNGEYWGIYWFREYIDEHYVLSNFGVEDTDLLRSRWNKAEVRAGDNVFWGETFDFIKNRDLTDPNNFQEVCDRYIDLDSFTDYYVLNLYAANTDWPQMNQDWYRDRSGPDGRWKWILWDSNYTWRWDANHPTLEWATRDQVRTDLKDNDDKTALWSTVILRQLLENDQYRVRFVNRFCDLMNTLLTPESLTQRYNRLAEIIAEEMPRELDRWGKTGGTPWETNLEASRKFFRQRAQYVPQQIARQLDLSSQTGSIVIEPSIGQGRIRVNTIVPDVLPWEGLYFKSIPIPLEAIPNSGWVFEGWSLPELPTVPSVSVTIPPIWGQTKIRVHAVFREIQQTEPRVVINEINYNNHPDFETGDWVELFNDSSASADLSGWTFQDSDTTHAFVIPHGSVLEPHGYLVLCEDTSRFYACFWEVSCVVGSFSFGLSGSGESIKLMDSFGQTVDSLGYDDSLPWPVEADGLGSTLELIDPSLDNTLPQSWQASALHGTPGRANSSGVPPPVAVNDSVAINEINYHSPDDFDSGDWIELVNFSQREADVSGWVVMDSLDQHVAVLPQGTVIGPDSFLVVFRDDSAFGSRFPYVENAVEALDYGLDGEGDVVRVKTGQGVLIDSLYYMHLLPWPIEADGLGSTLELIDPSLDNTLPQSWQASALHGTPGRANSSGVPPPVAVNDSVAINEINYHSPDDFDSGDWIEIVNFSQSEADVSGWVVMDSLDQHVAVLPQGTVIGPDSFLVVFRDDSLFGSCFPDVENRVGGMDFGLDGEGDVVRIKTAQGILIDSVYYMHLLPWPMEADGLGSTLELIDPLSDNILPQSWQASALHGTPGRSNSAGWIDTKNVEPARTVTEFGLFQNYPNPFNADTWIGYMVPIPCLVRIAIFNIHGQCVTSIDRMEDPGNHGIVWNGQDRSGRILPTGIYFCRMSTKTYARTIRMLLTK